MGIFLDAYWPALLFSVVIVLLGTAETWWGPTLRFVGRITDRYCRMTGVVLAVVAAFAYCSVDGPRVEGARYAWVQLASFIVGVTGVVLLVTSYIADD